MKKYSVFVVFGVVLSVVMLLSVWSCNRTRPYIIPTTWQVFPTDSGKYRIYEAWDTTFTNTGTKEGFHYFRKDVIGEQVDFESRLLTKVYSYKTADAQSMDNFELDRVYMIFKDSTRFAEVIRENVRELVLRYPIYADSNYVWDPYLYANTAEGHILRYRYQNVDTTVTVNGKTFEHCVFVMESDKSDLLSNIKKRLAYTVYAPGVGKILRYYMQIDRSGQNLQINTEKSAIHIEKLVEHN